MKVFFLSILIMFYTVIYAQQDDFVDFHGSVIFSYNPTTFFGDKFEISNLSGVGYSHKYKYLQDIGTEIFIGGIARTLNVHRFTEIINIFGDVYVLSPHIEFVRNNFLLHISYRHEIFRGRTFLKNNVTTVSVLGNDQYSLDQRFNIGIGKRIPVNENHFKLNFEYGRNAKHIYFASNPMPVKTFNVYSVDFLQRIKVSDLSKIKRLKNYIPYYGQYLLSTNMQHTLHYDYYETNHGYIGFTNFFIGKYIHNRIILGCNINNGYDNLGNDYNGFISISPEFYYMLYKGIHLNTLVGFHYFKTNLKYVILENILGVGTFFQTKNNCLLELGIFSQNYQFFRSDEKNKISKFQNIIAGGIRLRYHFIL